MLLSLQRTSRVRCGFASLADVVTGRLDDRMDSYFLSETLKYLFLTFDDALQQRPNRRDLAFAAAWPRADAHRAFAQCSATLTDGARSSQVTEGLHIECSSMGSAHCTGPCYAWCWNAYPSADPPPSLLQ